jgi:hypothetical protein
MNPRNYEFSKNPPPLVLSYDSKYYSSIDSVSIKFIELLELLPPSVV